MSIELYSLLTLIRYLNEINLRKVSVGVDEKLIAIITYVIISGKQISEYNLLAFLSYAKIDFGNKNQLALIQDLLSFYVGAGMVEIIDNGLGIASMITDENNPMFRYGKNANTFVIQKNIEDFIKIFEEDYFNKGEPKEKIEDAPPPTPPIKRFSNPLPDQESMVLGISFCPHCNKKVNISDKSRFSIHYPLGLSNPYAIVECEECNNIYRIDTTWSNAYMFDVRGCEAIPFSFARGKNFEESDIMEFVKDFDERMNKFLDAVEKGQ